MTDHRGADWQDRANAFGAELRELCEKHGLVMYACSCCDGINLMDLKESRAEAERMNRLYHPESHADPLVEMLEDIGVEGSGT